MDRRKGGLVDGQMDWMHKWKEGRKERRVAGWMDGWMDGSVEEGWMDQSMDRHTLPFPKDRLNGVKDQRRQALQKEVSSV